MDLFKKTKAKLFVNIFPCEELDWDYIKIDTNQKVIYVKNIFEFHSSPKANVIPKFWCFKTDRVFLNWCQSEIYKTVIENVTDNVYLGIDHVLMSYGQNYSGKTFTLSGLHNQFNLRGIIPRFVTDLFNRKDLTQENYLTEIWISSVDLSQNAIYDLLSKPPKQFREPKEVKKLKVKNEMDCLEMLFKAEAQRKTLDQKSYNSHIATNIVTFTINVITLNKQEPNDKISKVHFVDLAGVETIGRNLITSFKDKISQGDANVTKSMLEMFALKTINSNKTKDEMFQVNKNLHLITQYLDKSFSSTSTIKLICHIRPRHEDLMITLSVLRFSLALQGIRLMKPEQHLVPNDKRIIESLQEQVKSLEDELLLKNFWEARHPMKISQERIDLVEHSVKLFLRGNLTEIELLSVVDDCNLILNIVRKLHEDKKQIDNPSVALQTEEPEFISWFKEGTDLQKTEVKRKSTAKSFIFKEKNSPEISIRQSSLDEKSRKKSKAGKSTKSGKQKSEKSKENKKKGKTPKVSLPVLVSEEVQVNLIEPKIELPKLGSREELWAAFVISKPDIQEFLDKLQAIVQEKEKTLKSESLAFDNICQTLKRTQLALDAMASFRHFNGKEEYDKEGKIIVPDEESKLVKDLKLLQQEFEISQLKVIEAQTDWLDVLDKMNCEKKIIEDQFKQFCILNNLLTLEKDTITQNEFTSSSLSLDVNKPLQKDIKIVRIPSFQTESAHNGDNLQPYQISQSESFGMANYEKLQIKYLKHVHDKNYS